MRLIPVLNLIQLTVAICMGQSVKPRVFVSDSNSWEISGGFFASNQSAGGSFSGGARPQTVEIIKTFGQRCQSVVITMDKSKADYVVLFDREGGKGTGLVQLALKHDKIAIFKRDGDLLYSGSTRSVGNAVQDSCEAIERQNSTTSSIAPGIQPETLPKYVGIPKGPESVAPTSAASITSSGVPNVTAIKPASVSTSGISARFKSTPANAEVDVDGVYWGTTPTVELTRLQAGTHTIIVKKLGYKLWERKIDLAVGDDLTVNAALEVDSAKPRISGLY